MVLVTLTNGDNRMPSESFFDDGIDEGQIISVIEVWEAILTNNSVDLRLSFALYVLMHSHC